MVSPLTTINSGEAERKTRWLSRISWSDSDGEEDLGGNHDYDDADDGESRQASDDRRMSDVDNWSSSEVSAS